MHLTSERARGKLTLILHLIRININVCLCCTATSSSLCTQGFSSWAGGTHWDVVDGRDAIVLAVDSEVEGEG